MTATTTDLIDGFSTTVAIKAPCVAATTANITLSGEQTIDGVACVTNDRVLVKDQTDATQNGIWLVNTSAWSRDKDFDGSRDITRGTVVKIVGGSINAGWWAVTTTGTIVPGTSSLAFARDLVSDSSTVTFTASGTGAVARTVQSKEREIVSITDYENDDNTQVSSAVADNATGILKAINAVPDGGYVYVPPVANGGYGFSSISTTKAVSFVGGGFRNEIQDIFGAAAWSDTTKYGGSVLISTATSGDALAIGDATKNKQHQHRDIMILGPGSGTSVGLHLKRSVGSHVSNVLVANFATGWDIDNCQDATFDKLAAKGCKTGATVGGTITSNQCVFNNPEVQSFDTYGFNLVAIAMATFMGGVIQDGRAGGWGMKVGADCSLCTLIDVWFEGNGNTGALDIYGDRTKVYFSRFASATDHIVVRNGADRTKLIDNQLPLGNLTIDAGATYTHVEDSTPNVGTFTDNGTDTLYIDNDLTGGGRNIKKGNHAVFGSSAYGGAQAEAKADLWLTKKITAIADATFTSVLSVQVPNAAHTATLRLTALGIIGAGGAIGTNEASHSLSVDVAITRTPGVAMAVTASATYGSAAAAVVGATTCTVAFDVTSIAGAVGATQTLTVRVSITKGGGASANHICILRAGLLNANASGIVIF